MDTETRITITTCLRVEQHRHLENAADERYTKAYRAEAEEWVRRISKTLEEVNKL